MKKSTVFALAAVACIGGYFWQRAKEGNHNKKIKGIDLKVNPELLIDTALGSMNISPLKREILRSGSKTLIRKMNPLE
jgi:hypothetical protein